MEGVDLVRALGVYEMTAALFKAGWSGEELKDFVEIHKGEGFATLDRFSGGSLSEMKGTPLFSVMLEITAIRYALEKTKPGHGIPSAEVVGRISKGAA